MKKEKYYFEAEDAEGCYTKDYFLNQLDEDNPEIEVFEAVKERIADIFWCNEHEFCGDKSSDNPCGKYCKEYDPRNGVSGCCRHYRTNLYYAGEKITLKREKHKAMQYEPVLCTVLLDWFDKNYIESKEECVRLIIKGTTDYPFTPEQLKEGCVELKKTMIQDESLYTHIKLIGDIYSVGVSASIAGEQIREIILKMRQ